MFDERYALAFKAYPYERNADQDAATPVRHPVVVMGGGPVGMATALDLGRQNIPVVVLDDHEGVGMGSRAVLEVRGFDAPFVLEHGQVTARLTYERLTAPVETGYGAGLGSNYQGQGLRLSKHFRRG